MLLRRCAILLIEPRETLGLDLAALFSGMGALGGTPCPVALAAHLEDEVLLQADELAPLLAIGPALWQERAACDARFGATTLTRLLDAGLLIGDAPEYAAMRARDEALRALHWQPLAAIYHRFGRWRDVAGENGQRFPTFDDLVARFGMPPPATITCCAPGVALPLPEVAAGLLDPVLLGRYTGRNFDPVASLPLPVAARLLQRTFGAQQQRSLLPGAQMLKKTSPSGGSLHPIEAYLLVQRVAGVAPGLYHYHPLNHVLEPITALSETAARELALSFVAQQDWFANAPLLVVLAARVGRTFWKYRNHAKAYRVLLLDAGHLSQTFYLLATESGLPAFVTAGINEANIEQAFGFEPASDAVLAVCGCGAATGQPGMAEFRPAQLRPG